MNDDDFDAWVADDRTLLTLDEWRNQRRTGFITSVATNVLGFDPVNGVTLNGRPFSHNLYSVSLTGQ
jgi:hypothetical protein